MSVSVFNNKDEDASKKEDKNKEMKKKRKEEMDQCCQIFGEFSDNDEAMSNKILQSALSEKMVIDEFLASFR